MNIREIKKAQDSDLVMQLVCDYSSLVLNYNLGMGTKSYDKRVRALTAEMVKRNLLSEEDSKKLNDDM